MGDIQNNIRTGKGIEKSKYNEYIYEGEFLNDQYHGIGSMSWCNGASYRGYFRYNKKYGFGYERYGCDSEYLGTFKNGVANGKGIFILNNKKIIYGYYRDGILVQELNRKDDEDFNQLI